MIDAIRRVQKILSAIMKLLPVLIEVIEDFADDGKLNKSNK